MSVLLTFLLCLLSEAHRGEGLGIPSPHLGCHTCPGVVAGPVGGHLYLAVPVPGVLPVFCGAFVLSAYGSTVATCYVSLQKRWNFTPFLREGGPRILRSFFVVLLDFLAGLLLTMHLALCFLRLCHVSPEMLGIMAVLDQKDSYAVACARLGLLSFSPRAATHAGHHGRYGPEGQEDSSDSFFLWPRSWLTTAVACSWLVMLAQRTSCCVSFVVGRPVPGYLVSGCFQRHDGHRDGAGIMVAGEVAALVIDIVSGTFLAGFDGDDASAAFFVCGWPMISASWAVWRWPRSSSTSAVACACCLAGSARRYAATALWARIAFHSPWFVAPYGAVPGALGSLTPGVFRHGGTSKQLGRADFLGPCPQGHGHDWVHLCAIMDRHLRVTHRQNHHHHTTTTTNNNNDNNNNNTTTTHHPTTTTRCLSSNAFPVSVTCADDLSGRCLDGC